MARKRDRAFALTMAIVFLVTTVGLTAATIASVRNADKQDSTADVATDTQSTAETNEESKGASVGKPMENFTPVSDVTELKIEDIKVGDGDVVQPGATVTVDYTGAVAATGDIFQSSKDFGEPVSFGLSGVIAGWTEGIPGMKVGGVRRLTIPAEKAYGANPPAGSGIPANAALVFDVELHKIGE
jgi:FKBP-type peptidyl-prolyl cis-trans isomerase